MYFRVGSLTRKSNQDGYESISILMVLQLSGSMLPVCKKLPAYKKIILFFFRKLEHQMSCALGHVPCFLFCIICNLYNSFTISNARIKEIFLYVMIMNNYRSPRSWKFLIFTYIGFMYQVNFYSLCTLLQGLSSFKSFMSFTIVEDFDKVCLW